MLTLCVCVYVCVECNCQKLFRFFQLGKICKTFWITKTFFKRFHNGMPGNWFEKLSEKGKNTHTHRICIYNDFSKMGSSRPLIQDCLIWHSDLRKWWSKFLAKKKKINNKLLLILIRSAIDNSTEFAVYALIEVLTISFGKNTRKLACRNDDNFTHIQIDFDIIDQSWN